MTGIDPAMFELFREEVRSHAATLARRLLDVESDPTNPTRIEPLMRAAHSIKGACRIVGIDLGVRLAHVMEDALVAAQRGTIRLTPDDIDALLKGDDVLATLSDLTPDSAADWGSANAAAVARLEPVFVAMAGGTPAPVSVAPIPDTASQKPSPTLSPDTGADFPSPPPFEPTAIPPEPLPLTPEHSMFDLFREELRGHLLVAEGGDAEAALESLKQIRGAARIVKCEPIERVAIAISSFLSAVREGRASRSPAASDWLRLAVSTLAGAVSTDDETLARWMNDNSESLKKSRVSSIESSPRQFRRAPRPSKNHNPRPSSLLPRRRPPGRPLPKRSCGLPRRA